MKSANFILSLVILLGACSSPKKTTSTNEGSSSGITNSDRGRDGLSFEKAIIINKKREGPGVDAEYKWLAQKYPGYKMINQSLTHNEKRHYDIIKIQTRDGEEKNVYFDISNFFGKW